MTVLCIFLQLAVASASRDWLAPFQRLQVSSPMVVHVVTDPARQKPDLDIAADSMGLGWTVQSQVQPMTFGSTLLLGMDERAARQDFSWPAGGQVATLFVPKPLDSVSVTGGAQVWVDVVTGDLSADGKSNLSVQRFQSAVNRSHLFLANDANITVHAGDIGEVFVQAWNGAIVNLQGARVDSMLNIKVDTSSSVLVKAAPLPHPNATAIAAANLSNSTTTPSNVSRANVTAVNAHKEGP